METFSALLAICAGNSPVPGEFPTQRPVTRSFDVYFDLRPNKRLSKQSWGWWFETLSPPLWRHRNEHKQNQWKKTVCILDGVIASISTMIYRVLSAVQRTRFSLSQWETYHKTSSISRKKSQNLNVSCILLQLSLLNPLKPCVKLRMKM